MKKLFYVLIATALLFTGCSKEEEERTLDLELAKEKISSITFDEDFKFDDEENINNNEALSVYGVDSSLFEESLFYLSSTVVDPSMYLIVKANSEDEAVLKYQIEEMFTNYYNYYNSYYPEEAKMIEDRLEKELDGYLIYIVSYDNDAVYQAIEESLK